MSLSKSSFPFSVKHSLLILHICLYFLLPLGYETNDDIFIELSYSGHFTGHPEYGGLFQHILLGKCLSFLYSINNAINWYGILLNASLFLASFLLCSVVIDENPEWQLPLLALVIGTFCIFSMKMNFATVSFFCGFSAIISFFTKTFKFRSWRFIILIILICLSITIRAHFFILSMFLAAPVVVNKLGLKDKMLWYKLAMLFAIYFLFSFSNQLYYNHDLRWKEFHSLYASMVYLLDNDAFNLYYVRDHLKSIGWTENDFQLFKNFYFELPGNLEINKMNALSACIPWDCMDAECFYPVLFNYFPKSLLLVVLLSWYLGYLGNGAKHLAINLLLALLILLLLHYLSGNKYVFKNRLLYPVYFALSFNFLFSRPTCAITRRQTLLISSFIILLISIHLTTSILEIHKTQASLKSINKQLETKYKGDNLFDFYCYFPNAAYKNWQSSKSQMQGLKFLPMGWIMCTPSGREKVREMGYSSLNAAITDTGTIHMIPNFLKKQYEEIFSNYTREYNGTPSEMNYIDSLVTPSMTWYLARIRLKINDGDHLDHVRDRDPTLQK